MTLARTPILAALLASSLSVPALARPGDLHEVAAELVNLRSGPADTASVRDRVAAGAQVIELRRDGGWVGVRVVPTGQEGWVYGELLRQVDSSQLGDAETTAGFAAYSTDLDGLLYQVSQRLGTPMMTEVAENGSTLTLTPSESWLRVSSQDAQLMAAAAIYGMWKNYRDQAPVEVLLLDAAGEPYVSIRDDGEAGPQLTVVDQASGSES